MARKKPAKKRPQPRSTTSPVTAPAAAARPGPGPSTLPAAAERTARAASPAQASAVPAVAKDDVTVQYAYVRRDLMRVIVLAILGLAIIVAATVII